MSVLFVLLHVFFFFFFFFNDTATTEIYTLSLHDALPISLERTRSASTKPLRLPVGRSICVTSPVMTAFEPKPMRSEEHTSELQSRQYLVCRLLLEKKKKKNR